MDNVQCQNDKIRRQYEIFINNMTRYSFLNHIKSLSGKIFEYFYTNDAY